MNNKSRDPSFKTQAGLFIHLNTYPPHGWRPAIRDPHLKTLAGVVVVVIEATRASITKPHGLLGRRGRYKPHTDLNRAGEST